LALVTESQAGEFMFLPVHVHVWGGLHDFCLPCSAVSYSLTCMCIAALVISSPLEHFAVCIALRVLHQQVPTADGLRHLTV